MLTIVRFLPGCSSVHLRYFKTLWETGFAFTWFGTKGAKIYEQFYLHSKTEKTCRGPKGDTSELICSLSQSRCAEWALWACLFVYVCQRSEWQLSFFSLV